MLRACLSPEYPLGGPFVKGLHHRRRAESRDPLVHRHAGRAAPRSRILLRCLTRTRRPRRRNAARVSYDRRPCMPSWTRRWSVMSPSSRTASRSCSRSCTARVGDRLYLHGSTGARALKAARGAGLQVCVTVTLTDGLVLARSAFHHSINYRSVVAHGTAHLVDDDAEKHAALAALVEAVAPGRSEHTRPPSRKELAATAVLPARPCQRPGCWPARRPRFRRATYRRQQVAYLDVDDPIREVRGYAQQGAAHGDTNVKGRDAQPAALSTSLAAPVITAARPRRRHPCG